MSAERAIQSYAKAATNEKRTVIHAIIDVLIRAMRCTAFWWEFPTSLLLSIEGSVYRFVCVCESTCGLFGFGRVQKHSICTPNDSMNNNNNNAARKPYSSNVTVPTTKEILRFSLQVVRFLYNDPFWHANIGIVVAVAVSVVPCACVWAFTGCRSLSHLLFHSFSGRRAVPCTAVQLLFLVCAYYMFLCFERNGYTHVNGFLDSLCLSLLRRLFWFVLARLSYSLCEVRVCVCLCVWIYVCLM